MDSFLNKQRKTNFERYFEKEINCIKQRDYGVWNGYPRNIFKTNKN